MFVIEISVGNGKRTSVKLERFGREYVPNIKRGINAATMIFQREIKLQLSLGGRAPRRKGEGWWPNPGPHLRIGDGILRSSWKTRAAREIGRGVEGAVATSVPYAAIHEFSGHAGRGGATFIRARSYVAPAVEKRGDEALNAIGEQIMKPLA